MRKDYILQPRTVRPQKGLYKLLLKGLLFPSVLLGGLSAYAQSPGGVPVASWWRADAAATVFSDAGTTQSTDSSQLYQWNDYTGHGYNFIQTTAGDRPIYSNGQTMANFNPTITFSTDWMDYTPATVGTKIISRAHGALYAAGYMNAVGNTGFFGFDASNDFPGLHTYPVSGKYDLLFFTNGGPGYQGLSDSSFQAKTYFTAGAWWQNGAGGTTAYAKAKVSLNGNRVVYSGNQIYNVDTNTAYDDMRIGWDNNWGALNGQLNELMIFEDTLTSAQMDQVETYLAIKYGSTYAYGLSDYKMSNGTAVWTAANNVGNNQNIAGIAHDVNGALYQKQSWSTNVGKQVLISTTGLANTNAANTGTLSNNQYLVWGDNGLARTPSVAITNVPGTNFRFASVWKVQNTGSVGIVRVAWPQNTAFGALTLVQSLDSTFATGNNVTDMTGNTQVVNGVTYNYADVVLVDGQYFTFAIKAYTPGGIAALPAVWYRPDMVNNSTWTDASVNSLDLTTQDATATYSVDVNNGNQVHNFHKWTKGYTNVKYFSYREATNPVFGTWADGGVTTTASTDYATDGYYYMPLTVFGVARDTGASNSTGAITGIDNDQSFAAEPGFGIYNGKQGFYRAGNGADLRNQAAASVVPINATSVYSWRPPAGGSTATGTDSMQMGLNGNYVKFLMNRKSSVAGPHINIGTDNWAFPSGFDGSIQEVVWYKDSLSNSDIAKVETYLALKFGSTLAHNYVDAAGDTVYSITVADSAYRYNIAGIGKEENNGNLNQRQSNSVNTGKQLIVATTGLANTNDANTTSLTEGQYLVWGDNGLAKSPSIYTANTFTSVNLRFAAIWKVQNTGVVGTVRVAWPAGLTNLSLIQSADTTFNASDVLTDMSANTQVVNGITYNYADVTLANGQYFTLAAKIAHAPGGVFTGLSLWYRADKQTALGTNDSVTTWTDYALGVAASQVGTNPLPELKDGSATYLNFNPGINFTNANQSLGNLTTQALSDTAYDIFTLTKEGVTAAGANARIFSVLANKSLTAGNIHYWDGMGINYTSSIERYNSTTGLWYFANPGNVNFATNSPSVMYNTFTNTTVAKGVNGANIGAAGNNGAYQLNDGGFTIGSTVFSSNGSDNYSFKGDLGETIVYGSKNLNANERNRVDAYLAIKYGITLDTAESYLTSGSTVVWDKTADLDFYHNVAGIGRDDLSDLYQKQSRSQIANNVDSQVTIALGDIYATNAANTSTLTDGQFLMWGDNGHTVAMSNTASTYTAFTYNSSSVNRRMTRVWKVRNTGVNSVVKIAFPQASVGTTTIPGETATAGYVILYSTDSTFSSGVTANRMTVLGSDYDALHNFPSGVSYFTYAKLIDTTNVPMSVGLSQFNAKKDGRTALLDWTTATESNNKGFDVERSLDGKMWQSLGFVSSKSENGNSTFDLSYSFTDAAPAMTNNLYRLKQLDVDGRYIYSVVRSVLFGGNDQIQIHPNPTKNDLIISGLSGTNQISVTNVIGQVVLHATSTDVAIKKLDVSHLTAGVYFITITDSNHHAVDFKVIKQ